ncbi:MAG TPA: translation initiation factor IF-2, partial [Gemmataceae bacterium]|nr:translation initiation factor IF-2 [Gemmataceae bacterium]
PPLASGARPTGTGVPTRTPPSPGAGRPGPGAAPPARSAGPGAPAAPTPPGGERHRRLPSQRATGLGRPGAPGAPGPRADTGRGALPPGIGGAPGRRFTPDEIRALREGRSLHEVKRQQEQPVAPAGRDEPDDEEAKAKKGAAPGAKGGEKDRRAIERAKRTEQRKQVKAKDVVVHAGQVDLADEPQFGSRRGPRAALLKKQRRQLKGTIERKGKVPISLPITVRSLSEAIGMKAAELLFKLKDLTNALFTINSTVEVEVAELIASEKGVELDIQRQRTAEEELFGAHEEAAGDESKLEPRAPIVTIMGHVDHGKTSLLDTIRKTYGLESDVVSTEAGGITQVIRAWRVEKDGKPITFLDTPGHEAFTKMRARGANVTDIAVIVVAADSGVQPQTEEAVAHAKAAGVSIVVAINKMDMPGADPAKVERQLYNLGLLPDTMGGDVQFVRTSAVKGTGIAELLDTLGLVAELKELKANPHKAAQGTCLEAYLSGDEGVMATLLVQQGTLHRGDVIVCGAAFGRVRAMYDDLGRPIKEAGPSVPVRITGLDEVPNADDHFHAVAELAKAREIAERRKFRQQDAALVRFTPVTLDKLGAAKTAKIAELKVILKAEARGSVEAIRKELEKLVHEEVRVRVLHAAIGAITESDVQLALASPEDSMVVGFNVVPDDAALKLAEERGIPIREYNIIYKLTEDIKAALEGKLKPEERVIHLGRAVVRQTFKISKVGTAAGCYVTQGVIERSAKIRVIREGAVVYPPGDKVASLESLKRFKDDVREVKEGYDCGMKIAGYDDIKVGDVIEAYRIEQVQRTL